MSIYIYTYITCINVMSTSPHPEQFADLSMTGNVTMAGFFMHSGNEWTTIYIYTLNISNDTNTWWVPLNQELDKNMIPPPLQ